MNRPRITRIGIAAMLLLAVVLGATALLVERWRNPEPLAIRHLMLAKNAEGATTLNIEGSGFERFLDVLLIPTPPIDFDNSQTLAPRVALYRIESDGRLAVASARGSRLVTLDVQEGRPPRVIGSLKLKEGLVKQGTTITSLAQIGTKVVAALSPSGGLLLVDLEDPARPRKESSFQLPGAVIEMLAVNGGIYAVSVKGGFWRISIDGGHLHAEKIPGLKDPFRVASVGNRLVVTNLHGDLVLYELDGAGWPRLVGRDRLPQAVRGITLGGDTMHLCLNDGTLREYAISAWPKFVLRSQLQLPGRPLQLVRSENPPRLFCNLAGAGVSVIDIGRAAAPEIAGWLPTTLAINEFAVVPGRLLTTSSNGLQIHAIEDLRRKRPTVEFPLGQSRERARLLKWQEQGFIGNSSRLVQLDAQVTGQRHQGMVAGGEGILAVPGGSVLNLYGVSENPGTAPVLRATLPFTGRTIDTLVREGRLYVLSETTLHVFASEGGDEYRLLGKLDEFESAQSLAWAGRNFLLIGDKHQGVLVVNVEDAAAPRIVGGRFLPKFINKGSGGVQKLLVSGERAFIARGEFGVQVLDLSDLPELQVLEQIDTPGIALKLMLHDDLLLVSDRGRGVQVVEMRSGTSRLLATIPNPSAASIEDLMPLGNELLMINATTGLMRLPLPRRLTATRFEGDARGTVAMPVDLPAGNYRLVLYDGTRQASADFSMN